SSSIDKANSSSNRALSHPIPANRIPVDPRNLLDCESFERFQDQTNLAFRQANSTFNQTMSSIPGYRQSNQGDTTTPFSSRIANTYLRDTYKLCIPEYSADFGIRKPIFDLHRIRSFEADLWKLPQAPNESLRSYVNRFKAIIAKIENPNEAVALLAFRHNLWYKSKFREELIVRPPVSLDDALRCASTFATFEEEINLLLERHRKGRLPQHSLSFANSVLKPNPSSDLEKFCEHHKSTAIPPTNAEPELRN
ncbi:unnamed protein product, partial [Microthlaspi erraticum]